MSSHGQQSVDPPAGAATCPRRSAPTEKIVARRGEGGRRRPARAGRRHDLHRARAGREPEGQAHRGQQRVRDLRPDGTQIGAVRQVGQSTAKKVLRVLTSRRPVPDPQAPGRRHAGQRAARPHPAGQGHEVEGHRAGRPRHTRSAQIVQQNAIGKIRFGLEAGGHTSARSTPRTGGPGTSTSRTTPAPRSPASPRRGRAWPRRCSPPPTTTSCRSTARSRSRCARLVVAAALAVDTALKQDSRGFG